MHTPPGSNKSNAGCATESDSKRSVTNNYHGTSSSNNGSNNPNTTGLIRNEELSKMFPTPPSLEQHPNSSPCGGSSGNVLENMEIIPNEAVARVKQEVFPLGSPQAEPIDVRNIFNFPNSAFTNPKLFRTGHTSSSHPKHPPSRALPSTIHSPICLRKSYRQT